MKIKPLVAIDFYKADHRRQYPIGTTMVNSNFTPRSVKHAASIPEADNGIVVFGLQYFIKSFLIEAFNNEFFDRPKEVVVKQYKRRMDNALGKDAIPVDHIERLHDIGYLPITVRALPEGSVVGEKIPIFTIQNTHPDTFWLVNYLESILSCMNWKGCTSATTARKYKQLLTHYANITGAPLGFIPFQAHDFSFRGMSSYQDAVVSGGGHLLSFVGTDTVPAIDFLEDYYGANSDKELIGCSVPATEHSVMCMGGKDGEINTFKRLITELYPKGIVSVVSDTWDFWQVVTEFTKTLKPEIMARDGKLVIRPDSGDPVKIIVGDPDAPVDSPQRKGAIECLWEVFGGTTTDKGYKVLDSHIGLIYGDSITLDRCRAILIGLEKKGFASNNVVFGVGSYTYTYVTRDTLGFAMKATAGCVDGEIRAIFKDPKTDDGLKKSARGFIVVEKDPNNKFVMRDEVSYEESLTGELIEVFRDGELLVEQTLSEIRKRVDASI